MKESEAFHELSYYTLSHPDNVIFIHQHIVDAQMAQTADEHTNAIGILYALLGLYLAVERNYPGRQVQQIHEQLSNNKRGLPNLILPEERGEITVANVLESPPGNERDDMIRTWCASVWKSY